MNENIVVVNNVTKLFYPALSWSHIARLQFHKSTPVTALHNVSFSLQKGRIIGILGPNGSGKTTLLKIIATLILPDKGTVSVNGYDVSKNDEKTKSFIGLAAAEERSFYWRLTGWQNLEFFATLYGLQKKKVAARINELLKLFNVDYHRKRFDSYSTGMKRKCALIRALLHDPDILLLDEPTKSLDYNTSLELRNFIAQLADRGKTILLATHTMEEAEAVCDTFLILHKGKLLGLGTKKELQEKTRSNTPSLVEIYLKLTEHASLWKLKPGSYGDFR